MIYIDLFSGAGGFSKGFDLEGFKHEDRAKKYEVRSTVKTMTPHVNKLWVLMTDLMIKFEISQDSTLKNKLQPKITR